MKPVRFLPIVMLALAAFAGAPPAYAYVLRLDSMTGSPQPWKTSGNM